MQCIVYCGPQRPGSGGPQPPYSTGPVTTQWLLRHTGSSGFARLRLRFIWENASLLALYVCATADYQWCSRDRNLRDRDLAQTSRPKL